MSWSLVLLVAVAGAIGSVLRFFVSGWGRPGVFAANTVACLAAGIASGWLDAGSALMVVLVVGLAGGLSTWSTLAAQVGDSWLGGKYAAALGYLAATLVAGVTAATVGFVLGTLL